MKLSELAKEPVLVKIVVDDENILAKYGEPIEFWMHDRQDMETYMSLGRSGSDSPEGVDIVKLGETVRRLVRDEQGNLILKGNQILPVDIMLRVIERSLKFLGNPETQTSETSVES